MNQEVAPIGSDGYNHPMKQAQLAFKAKEFQKPGTSFGGDLLKNSHAKTKRPLDSKLPTHLVLRATESKLRLPKNFSKVGAEVGRVAKKHGVRIYNYANVGNHLHLLIKLRNRASWAAFIRELTGRLAQLFRLRWRRRPFTRVVAGWRKPFQIAKEYVTLNLWEAEGFISRKQTRTLKDLRAIFADG